MKTKLSLAIITVCVLSACNSNSGSEKEKQTTEKKTEVQETPKSSGDNIISFKVDGAEVTSSSWALGRFDFGNGAGVGVNITSNMHEEPRTININVDADKPGTYPFEHGLMVVKTPNVAYGSYKPDYMKQMMNSFSFQDGEFTIVSIDTTGGLFNATFHGTAKNQKGEMVTITDGKVINCKLRPGVTRYK